MRVSYHNHTRWSDGTSGVGELIAEAERIGLDEVGISDHHVLAPGGREVRWSIPGGRLDAYVEDVLRARARSRPPFVRLGVEADYFPETIEALRSELARHPFDVVIGSVHFVGDFPVDERADRWDALGAERTLEVLSRYYGLVRELAGSRAFDVVAHLDLPKKFGAAIPAELARDEEAALDAIAVSGLALELNTAGWRMPAGEAYPSPRLLRAARERAIPLVISADAHAPEHLAAEFDRARALARDAGYDATARFERRTAIPVPL